MILYFEWKRSSQRSLLWYHIWIVQYDIKYISCSSSWDVVFHHNKQYYYPIWQLAIIWWSILGIRIYLRAHNWGAWDAWLSAPQLCHVTDLFAHDPLSSSGYPMITYTHPLASNLSIKTSVARRLQTNPHTHTHTHTPCMHKNQFYPFKRPAHVVYM